ncbi:MAG: phosphoenolpyruvate--protein phosphotransferase [Ignavibacteria bacterium]|nr:phosphoenolpyruvate--protein phosphotransferase [Ignavibacteria bacterium]
MNFNQIETYNKNGVIVLKGLPAAPGYAIGPAHIYHRDKIETFPSVVLDPSEELLNLESAIEKSKKELSKIISISREKIGERTAGIFEAHALILDDQLLFGPILENIKNNRFSAEYSVDKEFSKYISVMKQSDDQILLERAADIEDLKSRLIRNLRKKRWESRLKHSVIIVAHSLTPADTLLFSRNEVLAYVSEFGGITSHAAIISRALNIPAVVGLHGAMSKISDEVQLIIDGFNGFVIINPDEVLLNFYSKKIKSFSRNHEKLKEIKNLPAETFDGHRIRLNSNIELVDEVDFAIANGAEGIGLFRTEELFFLRGNFPTEAEQIETYSTLAEKMYPETVVIRTFDLGGDKLLLEDYHEKNPFLGWRGIRMMLDKSHIFEEQLQAILISSVHKNVKIMLPMISTIEEIRQSKVILEKVKFKLQSASIPFDKNIEVGIMAEVPSIAFCISDFAKEVDFISVGTNDLTQYILAVDRGNEVVSDKFQEFHPAVLRALKMIIDGAHNENLKVSICGELASNYLAVPLLVGLGFDELSVNEHYLPEIKKLIRSSNISELKELTQECLLYKSHIEIIKLCNKYLKKIKWEYD